MNILIPNQPIPPSVNKMNRTISPNRLNCWETTTVDRPVSEKAEADINNASIKEILSITVNLFPGASKISPICCEKGIQRRRAPANVINAYQRSIFVTIDLFFKEFQIEYEISPIFD